MNRISKLRAAFAQNSVDAALITSYENMLYYSGFKCAEAYLLITGKDAYIFTDFRYTIQARDEARECRVIEISNDTLIARLQEVLSSDGVRTCGFEEEKLTVSQFREFEALSVELKPLSRTISSFRLFKDADEIENLRIAQSMADKAFGQFLERVRPGMTEVEAAAELDYLCRLQGSEGPSFDTIIGSGPNGAMCHAIPGQRKLADGDLVVVDFGCVYNGYHSDMTRTFGIGKVSDKCRRIYDIVLEAQLKVLDSLRSGISGKEMDRIARDCIASYGFGECFGHGLGHGFGLEIHEKPRASRLSEDTLLSGMTITDEPGIYLEGEFGVRIEDDLVVTDDGYINLANTTKKLIII
ncbi:MAG: aminopeptidase P family protein [Clostridia bacterium]|nr:aminopeptidase P family protein [Clostridia bacterium]